MNAEEFMKKVGFNGDVTQFQEAMDCERKEHSELSDMTVAHIAADHLTEDPEYYEEEEHESYRGRDEKRNKFKKMSRMKEGMEA